MKIHWFYYECLNEILKGSKNFHDLENLHVLDKYNLSKAWWLRTSGFSQKFAMNVENRIHFGGFAVNNPNVGVRPAILLNKK